MQQCHGHLLRLPYHTQPQYPGSFQRQLLQLKRRGIHRLCSSQLSLRHAFPRQQQQLRQGRQQP
jgi:hypothetical protein